MSPLEATPAPAPVAPRDALRPAGGPNAPRHAVALGPARWPRRGCRSQIEPTAPRASTGSRSVRGPSRPHHNAGAGRAGTAGPADSARGGWRRTEAGSDPPTSPPYGDMPAVVDAHTSQRARRGHRRGGARPSRARWAAPAAQGSPVGTQAGEPASPTASAPATAPSGSRTSSSRPRASTCRAAASRRRAGWSCSTRSASPGRDRLDGAGLPGPRARLVRGALAGREAGEHARSPARPAAGV